VLGGIHCNMLGDEKKKLVSTLENQKETVILFLLYISQSE